MNAPLKSLLPWTVLLGLLSFAACGEEGGESDCLECSNSNFVRQGACEEAGHEWGMRDLDGDGWSTCDDPADCDDEDPELHPAILEECDDGIDNDCDGLSDAEDPNCQFGDDDDAAGSTVPEAVELTTADGLTIRGTWQSAPGVASGPGVLLLHEYGHDRTDFSQVWFGFLDSGISVLAIDFRSHGESDEAPVETVALLNDPDQLRHDVVAGLEFIQAQDNVDPARVGIMGLSVGANMAVVANHNRDAWGVRSIVAISANLDRIFELAETEELDLENGQYVAAIKEQSHAEYAQELYDLTAEPRDLQIVEQTSAHGAALLASSSGAQAGTVAWLAEQLEP